MKNLTVASKICLVVLVAALLPITPAKAYDWAIGGVRITTLEATYLPHANHFRADRALGTCASGTWLAMEGRGGDAQAQETNAKATYALLLSAKLSGTTVSLFGNNAGCKIEFVHLE